MDHARILRTHFSLAFNVAWNTYPSVFVSPWSRAWSSLECSFSDPHAPRCPFFSFLHQLCRLLLRPQRPTVGCAAIRIVYFALCQPHFSTQQSSQVQETLYSHWKHLAIESFLTISQKKWKRKIKSHTAKYTILKFFIKQFYLQSSDLPTRGIFLHPSPTQGPTSGVPVFLLLASFPQLQMPPHFIMWSKSALPHLHLPPSDIIFTTLSKQRSSWSPGSTLSLPCKLWGL